MAATISSSGTFSTISADERPVQHRSTVEERYDYDTLIYENDIKTNVGGFPELDQFIGLMAVAYGKPALACLVRLNRMTSIMLNRTRAAEERTFTP